MILSKVSLLYIEASRQSRLHTCISLTTHCTVESQNTSTVQSYKSPLISFY